PVEHASLGHRAAWRAAPALRALRVAARHGAIPCYPAAARPAAPARRPLQALRRRLLQLAVPGGFHARRLARVARPHAGPGALRSRDRLVWIQAVVVVSPEPVAGRPAQAAHRRGDVAHTRARCCANEGGRWVATCPRCGRENTEGATSCRQCGESLPPAGGSAASSLQRPTASEPVVLPRPSFWTPQRRYLLGIGLGLIPLALWLVAWSAGVSFASSSPGPGQGLSTAAVWLYLIQLVAGVICLVSRRARHVGYGLLTMVLVDPVVGAIGCVVIASRPRYVPVHQQPIPPPPPILPPPHSIPSPPHLRK